MKTVRSLAGSPVFWCGMVLCVAAIVLAANRPFSQTPRPPATFSGPTMGTRYTVKVVDLPSSVDPQTLEQEIHEKLSRIDALMSTYRSDSELSRLNRFDAGRWFGVSRETASVLDEAIRIGRLTDGAFDVTVGPLVNLWNFGPGKSLSVSAPSPEAIEDAKRRVGLNLVEVRLSPPAVRKKRKDLYIDLSGIAKGFAVDRIAGHLELCGIENYMIEVGGEIKAKGRNPQGEAWRIGVESPLTGTREIQTVAVLNDLAMATSGDYRNYFEEEGVRYSHIIDPRSGKPIGHKMASVTVLDRSCTRADALATALMVLGPDAGYDLALRERLPVLFIIKSHAGFVEKSTPDFRNVLQ